MKCPNCSSTNFVKRGKRFNLSGEKQLYLCNDCKKTFVNPDGFARMRNKKEIIAKAIHLHNDGLSLFKVQYHLEQHEGVDVTRQAIGYWCRKYSIFLKSDTSRSETKIKRKTALR